MWSCLSFPLGPMFQLVYLQVYKETACSILGVAVWRWAVSAFQMQNKRTAVIVATCVYIIAYGWTQTASVRIPSGSFMTNGPLGDPWWASGFHEPGAILFVCAFFLGKGYKTFIRFTKGSVTPQKLRGTAYLEKQGFLRPLIVMGLVIASLWIRTDA